MRIFAFSLLSLIASNSFSLYRGRKRGSSIKCPAFLFTHFAILQRLLLWGRLGLVVYLFINRLQLFLTSFFRVFFSWFLVSLYCLLSSGFWLLVYFLLTYRWLATRAVYYMDYACPGSYILASSTSNIVEFDMPAYLGLYLSFLVALSHLLNTLCTFYS